MEPDPGPIYTHKSLSQVRRRLVYSYEHCGEMGEGRQTFCAGSEGRMRLWMRSIAGGVSGSLGLWGLISRDAWST